MVTLDDHLTFDISETPTSIVGNTFLHLGKTSAGLILPVFCDGAGELVSPDSEILSRCPTLRSGFKLYADPLEQPKQVSPKHVEKFFGVLNKMQRFANYVARTTIGYGVTADGVLARLRVNYGVECVFFNQPRSTTEPEQGNYNSLFELAFRKRGKQITPVCGFKVFDYDMYGGTRVEILETVTGSKSGKVTFSRREPFDVDVGESLKQFFDLVTNPKKPQLSRDQIEYIGHLKYMQGR